MSGPNLYAVNPPPRPTRLQRAGGWWDRNSGKVVKGAAVGGVLIVGGVLVYVIADALLGGQQPPACQALQNDLQQYQNELMKIYAQGAQQGGTYTAAQATTIQDLQSSISNTIAQMTNVCVASPGTTFEKTLDQVIIYGLWAAAIAAGIVVAGVTVYAIRWLAQRWGGNADGDIPDSPADVVPSADFNPATAGTDAANAQVAEDFEAGNISPSEASTTAANLSANDPSVGVSSDIADYFSNLATDATEVVADILDALSALWSAIVSTLDDILTAFLIFLGV